MPDERDRCALCLGAVPRPAGPRGLCRHGPLRCPQLRALLWARPSGGTNLHPERVSCGAAKERSAQRWYELTSPASGQCSLPALQLAIPLCLPAEHGRAVLLKDTLLSSPETELPPQSRTFMVPDDTCSLQKQHCHVRTKWNPKASGSWTPKPPPLSSFMFQSPLHPLYPVSGLELQSGGILVTGYTIRPEQIHPPNR